ncbi:hypothetical protein I7I51_07889 [Histoplasma capsulatum]|uniref:Uncharacterized protein n=1 Tax=Ajellomyces capsulatus TaxID=5037 RepID=A0A8A1M0Z8_AJECA|nr:hypothetical protein I7I51_07889 [Histoplasma capsulatum]
MYPNARVVCGYNLYEFRQSWILRAIFFPQPTFLGGENESKDLSSHNGYNFSAKTPPESFHSIDSPFPPGEAVRAVPVCLAYAGEMGLGASYKYKVRVLVLNSLPYLLRLLSPTRVVDQWHSSTPKSV